MSDPASVQSPSAPRVNTKTVVSLAMLIAIAYVVMWMCKPIPKVFGILQFDFKDCVICIGGLIFGPMAAAVSAFLVAFIEMISASGTGPVGMLMNFLSTASFCCAASYLYKRNRTQMGAVVSLAAGVGAMVVTMLVWNYLVTPVYQHIPRETVAAMLPTLFLPFNLVKGGLNAAATMLLYKPVVTAMRAANLVPPSESRRERRFSAGFLLFSLALLATCIVFALVMLEIL